MINFYIPSFLRPHTDQKANVQVQGQTVGEAIDALVTLYPKLRSHLFRPDGTRHPFVHVFLNEADIRSLQALQTPVGDNDEITLVIPVAGG